MSKKVILYIYNSFDDPLFQSNMYKYMIDVSIHYDYQILLITYEQDEFRIGPKRKQEIKRRLSLNHVHWVPMKWRPGGNLSTKLLDWFLGLLVIIKYRLRGFNKIVSLATVSGSFAFLFSVMLKMDHYLYQYEPHSEFMVDFKLWKKSSIKFRLLNYLELLAGRNSKVIATGTDHMIIRLKNINSRAKLFRIPSCVDEELFCFKLDRRESLRRELGIDQKKVLVYAGKFGGIYYKEEVFELFKFLHELDKTFFFLILSPNSKEEIESYCRLSNLSSDSYVIKRVTFSEMPDFLSASDLGLVAVPPYKSQKFRSPIKVGEYLCCGVPYLVNEGISEDDEWAEKYNVGVVMKDYSHKEVLSVYSKIESLMSESKEMQVERCRNAGILYRGFSKFRYTSLKAFEYL